jgi:hypothetical protein
MLLIKVSEESEAKVFRALLETRQPIQSLAPADEHLYLVNSYQIEVLKRLGLPFEKIQQNAARRQAIKRSDSVTGIAQYWGNQSIEAIHNRVVQWKNLADQQSTTNDIQIHRSNGPSQ